MFDIAWTEMLVIALITIVVVGPRDLPKVMKTIASFVAKVRSFSNKFQADMDALARETELDDLRKQAKAYQATLQNPTRAIDQLIDPETGKEVRKPIDLSKLVVAGDGKSSGMPSLSDQASVRAPASAEVAPPDGVETGEVKAEATARPDKADQVNKTTETAPAPAETPDTTRPEEAEDENVAALYPSESDSDAKAEDVSETPRSKNGGGRG